MLVRLMRICPQAQHAGHQLLDAQTAARAQKTMRLRCTLRKKIRSPSLRLGDGLRASLRILQIAGNRIEHKGQVIPHRLHGLSAEHGQSFGELYRLGNNLLARLVNKV